MSAVIIAIAIWAAQAALALAMCLCVFRMIRGPARPGPHSFA